MKKLIFLLLLVISIYSFGQSVDGGLKTLTASGTDTYTITEALPAAYDPKERFIVSFANPNTITTPTLNRAALGAKFIKNADGTNPSVGAITGRVLLSYNGTYYQIVGGGGSAGGGSGTVTNVAALTLGTTGTDLSSSVANPTTTPVITLNVPTASGSNRGALSASDWSTFNGKQATGLSYLLASGGTATGTNTFAMGAFPFIMTTGVTTGTGATAGHQLVGNSLTTGNLFDASSSSVSTGSLGVFTSTSTVIDHTAGTNGLVEVLMSGANSTASKTAIGLYSKVINTGTTNTNIAGYFEASGGTTNLALRTLGSVFIANASGDTPTASTRLDVRGTGTSTNIALRVGDSANTQILQLLDNGNSTIGGSNSTLTVGTGGNNVVTITGNGGFINTQGWQYFSNNTFLTVYTPTGTTVKGLDIGTSTAFTGDTDYSHLNILRGFTSAIVSSRTYKNFHINPTYNVTAGTHTLYGLDYNPTLTITGTLNHIAQQWRTGNLLVGATSITADTKVDVRGISSGNILRLASSANTERFVVQDNGVILVGGASGTSGQVLTSNGSGTKVPGIVPATIAPIFIDCPTFSDVNGLLGIVTVHEVALTAVNTSPSPITSTSSTTKFWFIIL